MGVQQGLAETSSATVEPAQLVAAPPAVSVREIFRRFWPDAKPYRGWLLLSLPLIVAVPAIATVEVWLFKLLVDRVLVPGDLQPLIWISVAYVSLTLVGGLVSFVDTYLAAWIGERFLLGLRARVYRHLLSLSEELARRRLGDVLTRLTSDVQAIESFVLSGVAGALSALLQILFFTAALFYLQWELALVSLIVVPGFWLAAARFSRLIKRASREKRRRSGSLGAVAEEGLSNAALVQAYNRQGEELERFRRENEGIVSAELAATRLRALFAPVVDLIELAGALLVIGFGSYALSEGQMTLGGILAFLAYLTMLYGPVRDLSRLGTKIFAAAAAAERVLDLLDQEPLVRNLPSAQGLAAACGTVELDGVTFTYPGGVEPALEDVSLRVGPGETLALVGASGAGKSTVAKLLLRFHDPDSGCIRLDGHDLRGLRLESVRANVGVLLQEALLFHGTIRENIAYGRPSASEREVVEAARAAGVFEFCEALPDGFATFAGEKGRRLSGGQRQRIAIARALLRETPVLVMDEPSTGLDAEATRLLLDRLRTLTQGRTTIVISHNPIVVRDADSIAVLERGRVVEQGTHRELVALGGVYAALLQLQEKRRELEQESVAA